MVALDVERELELMRSSLQETSRAVTVRVMCATTRNLSVAVVLGCQVLHFTGHGENRAGLAFEDGQGRAHMLDAAKLRSLLSPGHGQTPIKLVVVSSCHSERAAEAFVAANVAHVVAIATDSLLIDVSAQYFTQSFYLALGAGKSVRTAFDAGVAAVCCSCVRQSHRARCRVTRLAPPLVRWPRRRGRAQASRTPCRLCKPASSASSLSARRGQATCTTCPCWRACLAARCACTAPFARPSPSQSTLSGASARCSDAWRCCCKAGGCAH